MRRTTRSSTHAARTTSIGKTLLGTAATRNAWRWHPYPPSCVLKLTPECRSVVGYMPFVGYVTIMLSEHPWLKTVMLGIMGLVVVLQRE